SQLENRPKCEFRIVMYTYAGANSVPPPGYHVATAATAPTPPVHFTSAAAAAPDAAKKKKVAIHTMGLRRDSVVVALALLGLGNECALLHARGKSDNLYSYHRWQLFRSDLPLLVILGCNIRKRGKNASTKYSQPNYLLATVKILHIGLHSCTYLVHQSNLLCKYGSKNNRNDCLSDEEDSSGNKYSRMEDDNMQDKERFARDSRHWNSTVRLDRDPTFALSIRLDQGPLGLCLEHRTGPS
ncbi:unnamed protein product, partial [Nesidiocoris tenuis]